MSFFEWFLEKNKPNEVGDLKKASDVKETQPNPLRYWLTLLVGQMAFWYIVIRVKDENRIENKALWVTGFAIYLIISFSLRPQPNFKNMGWLGFFDNPFRYTDDLNRTLFFFQALLLPGKIIMESFIYLIQFIARLLSYLLGGVKF
jgi:hypothetical protein